MKNLVILIKMQLKEQLNFKRLDIENVSKFNVVLSILGAILKFALITVLCGAFLWISRFLHIFSIGDRIPDTVISLIFTVMLFASMISCIGGLTKSMYYAKDNAVLLTLPAMPMQVYLSKLFIFFIFELKRNASFVVPLFIAYYFTEGTYSFGVYPWMLFSIFWVSIFTVATGALLSIPAMWIANFLRQRRWLQLTLIAAVSAAVIALFVGFVLALPETLDLVGSWDYTRTQIQAFFEAYKTNFSFFYGISSIFLGVPVVFGKPSFPIGLIAGRFFILVGLAAVFFGIGLLIVQPLFYKMASTPFEYLKKQTPPKPNRVIARRLTSIYTEFLKTVKSSNIMAADLSLAILTPLLMMLFNKLLFALDISRVGECMIVAFDALIILLIVLNSNSYPASIFSRDGRSSYLLKTQPSKYPILIFSKILPTATFGVLAIGITLPILIFFAKISMLDSILLSVSIGFIYVAHMFYCAELDLMNPQTELYATVGSTEANPNETKATASAFIISFLTAGVMFLLLLEGSEFSAYIKLLIIAVIAFIYRLYLFVEKINLYYKEK